MANQRVLRFGGVIGVNDVLAPENNDSTHDYFQGGGASQSIGMSPIGAPGGASGGGMMCQTSAGRSRNRLMSAAISVRCAVSASVFAGAAFNFPASFDSFSDAIART